MTKVFLVLLFYGNGGSANVIASTTMPMPYPYEECRARGQDFTSINPKVRGWLCIVSPDAGR